MQYCFMAYFNIAQLCFNPVQTLLLIHFVMHYKLICCVIAYFPDVMMKCVSMYLALYFSRWIRSMSKFLCRNNVTDAY